MRLTIRRFLASICCSWQLDQLNRNIDFTPNRHTHSLTFTLACTLPLAVIITLHPLSDSVYWLSGQGLGVLSPITAFRAEWDSINVKLVNSRGASGCFFYSQAGKWAQTSKCHLWLLGRLNGLLYIWGERKQLAWYRKSEQLRAVWLQLIKHLVSLSALLKGWK